MKILLSIYATVQETEEFILKYDNEFKLVGKEIL